MQSQPVQLLLCCLLPSERAYLARLGVAEQQSVMHNVQQPEQLRLPLLQVVWMSTGQQQQQQLLQVVWMSTGQQQQLLLLLLCVQREPLH